MPAACGRSALWRVCVCVCACAGEISCVCVRVRVRVQIAALGKARDEDLQRLQRQLTEGASQVRPAATLSQATRAVI